MSKEELLEFPGIVTELLPNATFREAGERARNHCPYRWQNAQEPHSRADG